MDGEKTPKVFALAFTWAPAPAFHTFDIPGQFSETFKVVKLLARCCDLEKTKVYPELTLAGNIHYHSYLVISDKVKWFRQILPTFRRHGFVTVKPIINNKGWFDYIEKEAATMQAILEMPEDMFGKYGLNLRYKKPKVKPPELRQNIYELLDTVSSGGAGGGNEPPAIRRTPPEGEAERSEASTSGVESEHYLKLTFKC